MNFCFFTHIDRVYSMKATVATLLLLIAASVLAEETNTTQTVSKERERPWLISPIVVANPAFGNGGGAIGMYFFNTDKDGSDNPDSSISGVGMYSDTDSYFIGLFGQTFWKEDTWRITAGVAHPRIKNDFDIDLPNGGTLADVKFTTEVVALLTRIDRRVYKDFFLGVKGFIIDTQYSDANDPAKLYFQFADVEDSTSGQLGLIGSYDSRDHVRYPSRGNQSELSWTAAPESWGAPSSYHITEGFVNQFYSFIDRQVLAMRLYGRFTPSGTPYSGLSTLGRFGDLRGYTAGENVAENLIAAQTEYRMMFTKKIGGVVFGGVSHLYNGSIKNTNSDTFYPSYGLGFRYQLNTENKMNFRFDYAWGDDDEEGFYVSVGEAF